MTGIVASSVDRDCEPNVPACNTFPPKGLEIARPRNLLSRRGERREAAVEVVDQVIDIF
jgi:hypothetical protein